MGIFINNVRIFKAGGWYMGGITILGASQNFLKVDLEILLSKNPSKLKNIASRRGGDP